MTTPSRACHTQGCQVGVPSGFNDSMCLEHYLQDATQRLEGATTLFRNGQPVDAGTLEWMLTQVDFIIEAVGDETLSLDPAQRSRLLELLLGVANLHEYIRNHSAYPSAVLQAQ